MRINNNIMAMNTHRQYAANNGNVGKSTERLSSGRRINRAGDDAAGLAISEKMRAQIRGLQMASKNSEDAISLVQTAEGALTETHAVLQRMRELAVQAASDTNDQEVDREALNEEFQALKAEIDDIANKTTFNTKDLLSGGMSGISAGVDDASDLQAGADGVASIGIAGFTAANYTITFSRNEDLSGPEGDVYTAAFGDEEVNFEAADGADEIELDFGGGRLVTITTEADFAAASFEDAALAFTVTGAQSLIQTGANQDDTLSIEIADMRAAALRLDTAVLTTQPEAADTITTVNNAINMVSAERSKLGALQNRLEHKISNLDTSAENLQAAESRIRDLDMAKEMTVFTQNNILVQAATAMLAQANAAPQSVLSLLE